MKKLNNYIWSFLFCFVSSGLYGGNSQSLVSTKNNNWNIELIAAPVVALAVGVNYLKLHQQSKLLQNQTIKIERLKKAVQAHSHLVSSLKKIEQSNEPAAKPFFARKELQTIPVFADTQSLEDRFKKIETRLQELSVLSDNFVQQSDLKVYQERVVQELLDSVEKAIDESGFITRADLEKYKGCNRLGDLCLSDDDSTTSRMGSRQATQEFINPHE